MNLELSPAYDQEAHKLLREAGLEERAIGASSTSRLVKTASTRQTSSFCTGSSVAIPTMSGS